MIPTSPSLHRHYWERFTFHAAPWGVPPAAAAEAASAAASAAHAPPPPPPGPPPPPHVHAHPAAPHGEYHAWRQYHRGFGRYRRGPSRLVWVRPSLLAFPLFFCQRLTPSISPPLLSSASDRSRRSPTSSTNTARCLRSITTSRSRTAPLMVPSLPAAANPTTGQPRPRPHSRRTEGLARRRRPRRTLPCRPSLRRPPLSPPRRPPRRPSLPPPPPPSPTTTATPLPPSTPTDGGSSRGRTGRARSGARRAGSARPRRRRRLRGSSNSRRQQQRRRKIRCAPFPFPARHRPFSWRLLTRLDPPPLQAHKLAEARLDALLKSLTDLKLQLSADGPSAAAPAPTFAAQV